MEKYPLHWPFGYERSARRINSSFKQTMDKAQQFLKNEVKRLGGKELVVSSNIPLRNDGMMYSVYMNRKIDDPGVAIYFKYKGKDITMCCDQYQSVWENVYALGKGIEALRGMERWGVSDFLERAFTGFTALPEMARALEWYDVLEVTENASHDTIKEKYRTLAKKFHPDNKETGNAEKFIELQQAYQASLGARY